LFGDGLDRLVFAVKQDERLAVDFRDAFERAPENGLFLVADGVFDRQWLR